MSCYCPAAEYQPELIAERDEAQEAAEEYHSAWQEAVRICEMLAEAMNGFHGERDEARKVARYLLGAVCSKYLAEPRGIWDMFPWLKDNE